MAGAPADDPMVAGMVADVGFIGPPDWPGRKRRAPEGEEEEEEGEVADERAMEEAMEEGEVEPLDAADAFRQRIHAAVLEFNLRLPLLHGMLPPGDGSGGRAGASGALRMQLQLEARNEDWGAGALDPAHFWTVIQRMTTELIELEGYGLPHGWTRAWDVASASYYFAHPETGEATWDEPTPPEPPEPEGPPPEESEAAEPESADAGTDAGAEQTPACDPADAPAEEGSDEAADEEADEAAATRVSDEEWIRKTTARAAMHPERLAVLPSRVAAASEFVPSAVSAASSSAAPATTPATTAPSRPAPKGSTAEASAAIAPGEPAPARPCGTTPSSQLGAAATDIPGAGRARWEGSGMLRV
jgi:hypothetical protein